MRHLKFFISALVVFAILLSVISWLMPSKIMLVRTVMIAADRQDIQFQFADLRNWGNWNPYFRDMPAGKMIQQDSNRLVWMENSDSMKMTLDLVSENQVSIKLEREGAYPMNNNLSILQIDDSPGWQVEWRVTASLPWYPWERFAAMFFDKTAGPSFEEALASLKEYCEKHN